MAVIIIMIWWATKKIHSPSILLIIHSYLNWHYDYDYYGYWVIGIAFTWHACILHSNVTITTIAIFKVQKLQYLRFKNRDMSKFSQLLRLNRDPPWGGLLCPYITWTSSALVWLGFFLLCPPFCYTFFKLNH